MNDAITETVLVEKRPPSPAIAALDQEIRQRYAKRTDALETFLMQWIRLDESQKAFFGARGMRGENYLQFALSMGDVTMGLGLAKMCSEFAGTLDSQKTTEFLNHIDSDGNDVWHYLADNLATNEDEHGLEIAKILIQLDIDYCRKNEKDESPLARLLIPEVKWQSINSMLQAKSLTIDEMEHAFSAAIHQNQQVMAEIMVGIFNSDLVNNRANLSNYLLTAALSPKAEKHERTVLVRTFFEYVGGNRSETVLMKVLETDYKDLFERLLQLLQVSAEEAYAEVAASDSQSAKAYHQVFIYRRVGRRNRVFQSALHKAVMANRPSYISGLLSMLRNEDLSIQKRDPRGQTIREGLVVDKNSPAPFNPAISLLLAQDARGNMPFHTAVLQARDDCLRKMMFGLSLTDVSAILNRIPNRQNLTIIDLISVKHAHAKLTQEIKAQRITVADAQAILQAIKDGDKRIQEFLLEALRKADDVMQRTGGKPVRPSFDLGRIPTVQLALKASAGAAPAERQA